MALFFQYPNQNKVVLGATEVLVFYIVNIFIIKAIFVDIEYRSIMMYVRNQFMGITLLFCWIQILDFLAFHPLFGPWAIIIGECLLDVGKFVVVLALFVFGYAMLGSSMNQPFGLPSEYINDPELNPDQLSQDKLFSVMAAEEANNPLFMFEVKGVRARVCYCNLHGPEDRMAHKLV